MKKRELPLIIVSLAALGISILSFFLPFLTITYYKSISGFKLIFSLYHRFPVAKTSSEAFEDISLYSYSVPLLLSFLFAIASVVLIVLFLKRKSVKWLNISVIAIIASAVTLAMQLTNSNSTISDFFGALSQAIPATNGVVYQVADVTGIAIGPGAQLYTVFVLVALIFIIFAKITERENADRSEHLQTPLSIAYKQFKRNKFALIGLFILAFAVIACFFGPVFSKYGMLQADMDIAKVPPSFSHIFGADDDGRDVLTRMLYGGRISLEIGFAIVFIELFIGTIVGGVAGFYGGWVDNVLMRIDDIFLSLPFWPIMLIVAAVMMDMGIDPAKRIYAVMVVLGLLFWPPLARLVRGQILSLREQEYVVAAEALGIRDRKRIFKHLVPNALPNIIVTATLDVGNAILVESSLSFLGLGVAVPYPSWGNIVSAVTDPNDFALRPWLWVPAGLCILITVLAINFVGDGLRDAFDPKMKR